MMKAKAKDLRVEQLEGRLLLAGDTIHRINAGGPQLNSTPAWTVDAGFLVQGGDAPGISAPVDISGLTLPEGTNTQDFASLFQTERFDFATNVGYEFPVTPGEYEVRLYFAETFNGASVVGGRVFDISIEDQVVAPGFDIYVAAGNQGDRGVVRIFTVTSDSMLDIDFTRITENPSVSGIEIVSLESRSNELGVNRTSLGFGDVLAGDTLTEQLVLTNLGDSDNPSITINPTAASVDNGEFAFTFAQASTILLAPGESTTVDVSYTPTAIGSDAATLSIPHSGDNSPLQFSLNGEGVDQINIGFTLSTLQGSQGLFSGTSLEFGPDGRLYVTQGFGNIQALEIERVGANDYRVVSEETITVINDIQNHEDDGTPNNLDTRLINGLVVTGTAADPVLHVVSSDPRTNENSSIDSNSGTISRLTRNSQGVWERLDLVRGIPRSGRDHVPSGLQFLRDENGQPTNTLLHGVGGFTNRGAPSAPFGNLPEYALGAAILQIDLDAIGDTTYDIPTLDDPTRANLTDGAGNDLLDQYGTPIDMNDVFGGNGGLNQARLVPDGPVQVFASGFRNPYDIEVTEAGEIYATDNGPNSGFGNNVEAVGGLPTNGTGGPAGATRPDQLHFVSEPGRGFFGHTNPTRANPQNTFGGQSPVTGTLNGVPFDLSNPAGAEFPFVEPGTSADGAIATFNSSTNGIVEYTTNNFGGQLAGDLLTVSLNGTVTRVSHDPQTGTSDVSVLANIQTGGRELDITVSDTGPLSGTVWVVAVDPTNGQAIVTILEPNDGTGGSADDLDGDGYSNDDEDANGTDPNNPASLPPDNDSDFVSDLIDGNDDNDARLDVDDPFAIDPLDGVDTLVGTFYSFDNFVEIPGGILGLGFTGAQTNGSLDYLDAVDPNAVTAIGAAGVFTVDSALAGTSRGSSNDQLQAIQFGVNTAQETEPFTALTRLLIPFSDIASVQPGQEQGIYLGTGDQDNYVSLIVTGDNGGALQVIREVGGVAIVEATTPISLPSAVDIELFLTVDPIVSTVQASFRTAGQSALTALGSPVAIPPAWLTDASLAVGVTSSNPLNTDLVGGGPGDFSVTYDYLGVVRDINDRGAEALVTVDAGGSLVGSSTFTPGSFVIENRSSNGQTIESVSIDLSTGFLPDLLFDANGGAGDPIGKTFTIDSGGAETGAVGVFSGARDGGFEALDISFSGFGVGESLSFSTDIDPTTIQGVAGAAPGNPGEISGLELSGATVTATYSDGSTTVSQLSPSVGSDVASFTNTRNGALAAPSLEILGVGIQPNIVAPDQQTARITAPVGATVVLHHLEGALLTETVPGGGFDVDRFESNTVVSVNEQSFVVGPTGFVDAPVTLLRTGPTGGLNYFLATVEDSDGRRSEVSQVLVEARPAGPDSVAAAVLNINLMSNAGPNQNVALNGTSFGPNVTPAAYSGTTFTDVGNPQLVTGLNSQLMDLVDSQGNATAIDVNFAVASGTFDFSSNRTSNPIIQNYFTINNGFGGNANDPDPATISLSDLDADTTWDIYFISQGDQIGQGGSFTINGQTLTADASEPTADTFIEGANYVVFTDVQANSRGQITALFDNFGGTGGGPNLSGTGFGVLNGIQLVRQSVIVDPLLGDYDGSGVVDNLDRQVWRDSYGSTTNLAADGNNDGRIDAADYSVWRDNLGASLLQAVVVDHESITNEPVATATSTAVSASNVSTLIVAEEGWLALGTVVFDVAAVAPETVTIQRRGSVEQRDQFGTFDRELALLLAISDGQTIVLDNARTFDSEATVEDDIVNRDEAYALRMLDDLEVMRNQSASTKTLRY